MTVYRGKSWCNAEKIKNRKAAGLDDLPPEYGRLENLTTYSLDYATLSIHKTQLRNRQKAAFSPSPRKATSKSLRTIRAKLLLQELLRSIMLCTSIVSNLKSRKFSENRRKFLGKLFDRRFLQNIRFHSLRRYAPNTTVYGLPFPTPPKKKTLTALMMLCKNTKTMVCSFDSNTGFFDIIAGFLQEVLNQDHTCL